MKQFPPTSVGAAGQGTGMSNHREHLLKAVLPSLTEMAGQSPASHRAGLRFLLSHCGALDKTEVQLSGGG